MRDASFTRGAALAIAAALLQCNARPAQAADPSSPLGPAERAECPADTPALERFDAHARLDFLLRAFDREIGALDLWSWTWGSAYAAAAAAQGASLGLVRDRGTRIDLTVGIASAGIGAVSLVGLPLRITLPLRAARRAHPSDDVCRALDRAETTLKAVADTQKLSAGWVPHAGNVAFNLALGLVLGFGFGRWKSAAISGGIGVVVGEVNIWTQPHRLGAVLERYRAGRLDGDAPESRLDVAPVARGVGASALFRF